MVDHEKESNKALMKNGSSNNGKKINNKLSSDGAQQSAIINRQLRQLKRYMIGLLILLVLSFLTLLIAFSVLYANLKWDVQNHEHPPKVGAQMSKILEKEELCLLCDEVRLGPSLEEDKMLDYFVRKPRTATQREQCCVETPSQLLKILQLFVVRKYREEMAGNTKTDSLNTATPYNADRPAAHLMGSVRKQNQPSGPGRQFAISNWITKDDLAFTNNVMYRVGRIVITDPGLYYVYSQLSFLEVFDNPSAAAIDTGSQSLSHYIYRYNIIYPHGGEEVLIQTSSTKCWGKNKSFGEYTSYLGAVLQLRKGDELFVKVTNLTMIVPEPKLNFFGLFKVN